jgi:hypothetical protein
MMLGFLFISTLRNEESNDTEEEEEEQSGRGMMRRG